MQAEKESPTTRKQFINTGYEMHFGGVGGFFAGRRNEAGGIKDDESKEDVLAAALEAAVALAEEAALALEDQKAEQVKDNPDQDVSDSQESSRGALGGAPAADALSSIKERKQPATPSAASKTASQRLERAQNRMMATLQNARRMENNSDAGRKLFGLSSSSAVGAAAAQNLAASRQKEEKEMAPTRSVVRGSPGAAEGDTEFAAEQLEFDMEESNLSAAEATGRAEQWLDAWRSGGCKAADGLTANTSDPQGRGITADCLVCYRDALVFPGDDGDASCVSIYSVRLGSMVRSLRGHTETVCCVACERDVIASGGKDALIKLWSGRTGECTATLEGSDDAVHGLALRGDWLLSGEAAAKGAKAKARLWSVSSLECISVFAEHNKSIWSVALADGLALTASHDTTARAWSLSGSSTSRATLLHPQFVVSSVSAEGNVAATGCGDGLVRLWSLSTFSCIRTFAHCGGDKPGLRSMAGETFNPVFSVCLKGSLLVSGGHEKTVKVWSLDGECIATLAHGAAVRGLAVSGPCRDSEGFIASSGGKVGGIVWQPSSQQ